MRAECLDRKMFSQYWISSVVVGETNDSELSTDT